MILRRPQDIGALVRERRRRLKLTQTELAAKVGVSQRYVSHLEGGKSTLQLGLVLRVLNDLGLVMHVEPLDEKSLNKSAGSPLISIDEIVDD